jgi:hypothetical protein
MRPSFGECIPKFHHFTTFFPASKKSTVTTKMGQQPTACTTVPYMERSWNFSIRQDCQDITVPYRLRCRSGSYSCLHDCAPGPDSRQAELLLYLAKLPHRYPLTRQQPRRSLTSLTPLKPIQASQFFPRDFCTALTEFSPFRKRKDPPQVASV